MMAIHDLETWIWLFNERKAATSCVRKYISSNFRWDTFWMSSDPILCSVRAKFQVTSCDSGPRPVKFWKCPDVEIPLYLCAAVSCAQLWSLWKIFSVPNLSDTDSPLLSFHIIRWQLVEHHTSFLQAEQIKLPYASSIMSCAPASWPSWADLC